MRKLFALPFSIVFVMLLVLTTLALSLRSFVFDANFYVSTLKSQGVFQELEKDPLRFVDLTAQIPQLASIPEQLQQQVVATILPPGWLGNQVANAVQAWIEWFISGQAGDPVIPVDLRQIKDRLQGPPGQKVAGEIVGAIPTCTPDQQPRLSFTQLPECIPQVFDRNYIIEQVAQAISDAAGRMPGQYDIGPKLTPSTRFGLMFNGRRIGLAMLDTSLLLLALSTIGVWLIGAAIGGHGGRGRWSWLGGMLLAGSIAVLAVGLFTYVFGAALLPQAWFDALAGEGRLVAQGLAQAALQQLAVRSILLDGMWFIVAFVLMGGGMLRNTPQRLSRA